MHLSIGGNDLFDGIPFINNDAIVNSPLTRVVDDTEDIVLHMLSVRPDVEVFQSGTTSCSRSCSSIRLG